MGFLGHSEGVPEATLPAEVEWSHSRLFQPLSHCLYQAWLRTVLRIREPDDIVEELDPREIGDAVHDALEAVGASTAWRATRDDLEPAREDLVERLRTATAEAFADRRAAFGQMSEARQASTAGQMARWNSHWPMYARTRVQVERTVSDSSGPKYFVQFHPQQSLTLAALREAVPSPPVSDYTLGKWLSWASMEAARGACLPELDDEFLLRSRERHEALPNTYAEAIRTFVRQPSFLRMAALYASGKAAAEVFTGLLEDVAVEVPFGSDQTGGSWPIGEISLQLGAEDTAIRGRIDRMAAVQTETGRLLQITDYKTGRMVPSPGSARKGVLSLREPQLVLYALAVREAIRRDQVPEGFADATVAAVGYDHIRRTMNDGPRGRRDAGPLDAFLLDDSQLDHGAKALGWLLDEARNGRWTLAPRRDTCPSLQTWGHDYCPYAGACRLRGLPPEERGDS